MKKKQNSLLDKLKQENKTNQDGSNVLTQIEKYLPNISSNSLLLNKIDNIRSLQVRNDLNSSKEIKAIANEEFSYKYPFAYRIDSLRDDRISEFELIRNDTLINHVIKENELNNLKPKFKETSNLILRKQDTEKRLSNSSGYAIDYLKGYGSLAVILVIINMFGSTGGALQVTTFSIVLSLPIFYIISISITSTKRTKKKRELEKLTKTINSNMTELKTKANNGYK